MLLYIMVNPGGTDRYEIGPMASSRIDDTCGRLARRIATAALFALLSTSATLAEKPASASRAGDDAKRTPVNSTRESSHPAPPAGVSETRAPHHFGPRPDTRGAKVDKLDKPRTGRNDQGTKPGLQHGSKLGERSVDTVDLSVPRLQPKGHARDRLFKKIESVKLAPLRRPPSTIPVSPTGPARNAIGVVPVDPHSAVTHVAALPPNPGRGPLGLPNPTRSLVHLPPTPTAVPTPPRGLISGATVQHVGSGPGTLGGPARAANGINGTTFKPKH